jgi:hypothetical protein
MSSNVAPQRPTVVSGEVRKDSVSFLGKLDAGETLTGTPTISVSPAGLTCTSPAVSTDMLVIDRVPVAAGKAVTFTVSGGTAGVDYTVTVTVGTSNGQTLKGRVVIPLEA